MIRSKFSKLRKCVYCVAAFVLMLTVVMCYNMTSLMKINAEVTNSSDYNNDLADYSMAASIYMNRAMSKDANPNGLGALIVGSGTAGTYPGFIGFQDEATDGSNSYFIGVHESSNAISYSYGSLSTLRTTTTPYSFRDDYYTFTASTHRAPLWKDVPANSNMGSSILNKYSKAGFGWTLVGVSDTGDDSLSDTTRFLFGSITMLVYVLAAALQSFFHFALEVAAKLNPFVLFIPNGSVTPASTVGNGFAVFFHTVKDIIGKYYGAFYNTALYLILPASLGLGLFLWFMSVNPSSKNTFWAKMRPFIVRCVFVIVFIPMTAATYGQVVKGLTDAVGKGGIDGTNAILSTFCDFESWSINKNFEGFFDDALIAGIDVKDGSGGAKYFVGQDNLVTDSRKYVYKINKLTYANLATREPSSEIGGIAKDTISNDMTQGSNAQTHSEVITLLQKFARGDKIGSGKYASKYAENIDYKTHVFSQNWKSFNVGAYPYLMKPDTTDGAGYSDAEIRNYNVSRLSDGNTIWGNGSDKKLSTMAAYNYMNSTFSSSGITVYSPRASASDYVNHQHYAVSLAGTGFMKYVFFFDSLILIICLTILGYLYGAGMMFANFNAMFKLIGNVFSGLLGSLRGIATCIAIFFSLVINVVASIGLYLVGYDVITGFYDGIGKSIMLIVSGVTGDRGYIPFIATIVAQTIFIVFMTRKFIDWRKAIITSMTEAVTAGINKLLGTNAVAPNLQGDGSMLQTAATLGAGVAAAAVSGSFNDQYESAKDGNGYIGDSAADGESYGDTIGDNKTEGEFGSTVADGDETSEGLDTSSTNDEKSADDFLEENGDLVDEMSEDESGINGSDGESGTGASAENAVAGTDGSNGSNGSDSADDEADASETTNEDGSADVAGDQNTENEDDKNSKLAGDDATSVKDYQQSGAASGSKRVRHNGQDGILTADGKFIPGKFDGHGNFTPGVTDRNGEFHEGVLGEDGLHTGSTSEDGFDLDGSVDSGFDTEGNDVAAFRDDGSEGSAAVAGAAGAVGGAGQIPDKFNMPEGATPTTFDNGSGESMSGIRVGDSFYPGTINDDGSFTPDDPYGYASGMYDNGNGIDSAAMQADAFDANAEGETMAMPDDATEGFTTNGSDFYTPEEAEAAGISSDQLQSAIRTSDGSVMAGTVSADGSSFTKSRSGNSVGASAYGFDANTHSVAAGTEMQAVDASGNVMTDDSGNPIAADAMSVQESGQVGYTDASGQTHVGVANSNGTFNENGTYGVMTDSGFKSMGEATQAEIADGTTGVMTEGGRFSAGSINSDGQFTVSTDQSAISGGTAYASANDSFNHGSNVMSESAVSDAGYTAGYSSNGSSVMTAADGSSQAGVIMSDGSAVVGANLEASDGNGGFVNYGSATSDQQANGAVMTMPDGQRVSGRVDSSTGAFVADRSDASYLSGGNTVAVSDTGNFGYNTDSGFVAAPDGAPMSATGGQSSIVMNGQAYDGIRNSDGTATIGGQAMVYTSSGEFKPMADATQAEIASGTTGVMSGGKFTAGEFDAGTSEFTPTVSQDSMDAMATGASAGAAQVLMSASDVSANGFSQTYSAGGRSMMSASGGQRSQAGVILADGTAVAGANLQVATASGEYINYGSASADQIAGNDVVMTMQDGTQLAGHMSADGGGFVIDEPTDGIIAPMNGGASTVTAASYGSTGTVAVSQPSQVVSGGAGGNYDSFTSSGGQTINGVYNANGTMTEGAEKVVIVPGRGAVTRSDAVADGVNIDAMPAGVRLSNGVVVVGSFSSEGGREAFSPNVSAQHVPAGGQSAQQTVVVQGSSGGGSYVTNNTTYVGGGSSSGGTYGYSGNNSPMYTMSGSNIVTNIPANVPTAPVSSGSTVQSSRNGGSYDIMRGANGTASRGVYMADNTFAYGAEKGFVNPQTNSYVTVSEARAQHLDTSVMTPAIRTGAVNGAPGTVTVGSYTAMPGGQMAFMPGVYGDPAQNAPLYTGSVQTSGTRPSRVNAKRTQTDDLQTMLNYSVVASLARGDVKGAAKQVVAGEVVNAVRRGRNPKKPTQSSDIPYQFADTDKHDNIGSGQ